MGSLHHMGHRVGCHAGSLLQFAITQLQSCQSLRGHVSKAWSLLLKVCIGRLLLLKRLQPRTSGHRLSEQADGVIAGAALIHAKPPRRRGACGSQSSGTGVPGPACRSDAAHAQIIGDTVTQEHACHLVDESAPLSTVNSGVTCRYWHAWFLCFAAGKQRTLHDLHMALMKGSPLLNVAQGRIVGPRLLIAIMHAFT